MLEQLRVERCPRCNGRLVHEMDLAGDWALPPIEKSVDQRLVCATCGHSQPVTYVRQRREAARHVFRG